MAAYHLTCCLARASAATSLLAVALGLRCPAHAQALKPLKAVVGLGGLYGKYLVNQSAAKTSYPVPLLWAGAHYKQLGFQLGVAHYAPGARTYRNQYTDYSLRRTHYHLGSLETSSWLFPLLLRYGLRPAARRVQLEGIGGMLFCRNQLLSSSTVTDSAGTVLSSDASTLPLSENNVLLGLGVRCRLGAGLSLGAEGLTALHFQGYFVEPLPLLTAGLRYQPGRQP